MEEVQIGPLQLQRLAALLTPARSEAILHTAVHARELLADRVVWNVNATAHGGGVAEMLQTLLAYGRGAGVDTRWLVLHGDPEFFRITKRLHNVLHGTPGDDGELGPAQQRHYEKVLAANLAELATMVKPGDIVLLHDPQPGGMVEGLRARGAHVVWRCHIGTDTPNELTDLGWSFLRPHIEAADGFIFSRASYAPDWVAPERLHVIPPSIDPFTAKNVELSPGEVTAILCRAGLLRDDGHTGPIPFARRDGSVGELRRHRNLSAGGAAPSYRVRLVVQVSRWDRLKDMGGVLRAFAEHVADFPRDVHLMLVGPDVHDVSDDPEGAEVLAACRAVRRELPPEVRSRVHLVRLPLDDADENALLVNALQRHAEVVVQKSLVEGFGLTVTEAMWKGRPVVATAIGGICDQIVHGRDGLLLDDPADLDTFAGLLRRVLEDAELAGRLGSAAHSRVLDAFLGDRHLIQYVQLFEKLIASEPAP